MESLSSRPSTTAAVRVSNNYTSRVSSLAPWQAWRASEFVIRRDAPSSSQWNPSKGSSYPTTSISIRPPSLITQCRATLGLAGKGSRSAALQYCFNFIAILHPSNLFRSYYFEFISILLPELTQISVSERAHIFSLAVDKSMIDYLKKKIARAISSIVKLIEWSIFLFCTTKSVSITYIYISIYVPGQQSKSRTGLCNGMALIVLLNIPCLLNKSVPLYVGAIDISIRRWKQLLIFRSTCDIPRRSGKTDAFRY